MSLSHREADQWCCQSVWLLYSCYVSGYKQSLCLHHELHFAILLFFPFSKCVFVCESHIIICVSLASHTHLRGKRGVSSSISKCFSTHPQMHVCVFFLFYSNAKTSQSVQSVIFERLQAIAWCKDHQETVKLHSWNLSSRYLSFFYLRTTSYTHTLLHWLTGCPLFLSWHHSWSFRCLKSCFLLLFSPNVRITSSLLSNSDLRRLFHDSWLTWTSSWLHDPIVMQIQAAG